MSINPQGFPLDLTGANTRNLVVNDTRTIASSEDAVFVPDGGPFYTRTLVIQSGSKTLVPNVDYKCLHLLKDASIESGLDVSAIVMVTNESISSVTMSYQVIGGQYGETVPVIRQLLENAENLEKSINWNTHVYAKPDVYPAAPHFVSGEDFSDWSSVLNAIAGIERAILLKDVAAWESAFQYMDNLITQRLGVIDLSNFYTKSETNSEVVKMALKTSVYTKVESNTRHYSKSEVNALIGDIDGNETYYTENEINGKFIETAIADAKYATKAEINRVDSAKADKSSVYTRVQTDDRFPLKTTVYNKDYIDTTFVIKGTSFTKAEGDARYAMKTDAYNKVDSDKRYALKSQIATAPDLSKFISRDDVDANYLKINSADVVYLRKTTADSLYAKHTDLEIITVLSNKFAGYYTRLETDEKFITLTEVNSIFLTKTQGNSLYYTKTYSTTTFASKVELTAAVKSIEVELAKKVDLTYLNATYYTSAQTESKFYNKVEVDAKYPTKSYLTLAHYTKAESNKILEAYPLEVTVSNNFAAVNRDLDLRYTKAEVDTLTYTKAISDSKYLPIVTFNSQLAVINTNIGTRATTTWVNSTFYDKVEIDRNHYTKTAVDSAFYDKTESNARYQTIAAYTNDIRLYAKVAEVSTLDGKFTTLVNDRYKKSETWSKSEADSRYYLSNQSILNIIANTTSTYSGGLLVSNNHATTTVGASVAWDIRNDKVMALYPSLDTGVNDYRFNVLTKNVDNGSLSTVMFVHSSRIWHKTYGYLDTYFAKKEDHYAKSETYSKNESDARYYDKTYTDRTYVKLTDYSRFVSDTNIELNKQATLVYLAANFYTKTNIQSLYYTKTETTANFYTAAIADRTFASLALFDLEINKLVAKTTYDSMIGTINRNISLVYTKLESNALFATKTDIAPLISMDVARAQFPTKSEVATAHYTKSYSDSLYEPKGAAASAVSVIRPDITELQRRIEAYKIGDIYISTLDFSSSAAVNIHHGYGTWERYAEGRALVGFSPTGYASNYANNPDYYRDSNTATMGRTFGAFKHKVMMNEMPNHSHSTYPFNKFVGLANDVITAYKGRLTQGDNTTVNGGDTSSGHDELSVADLSKQMLIDATENVMGGGEPMSIVQASIVVGVWKRIR